MPQIHDVIIIGSGPAGLTAAIYTARANLSPLMLEGEPSNTSDQPGGQLMLTTDVENYPGFPEGIMGPELMSAFRSQALRFGTTIQTAKVGKVDFSTRPFKVWLSEDLARVQGRTDEQGHSGNDGDSGTDDSAGKVDNLDTGSSSGRDDSMGEPSFLGRSIIVATGAQALMLDLEGEVDFVGRGLSTCATCDGFFFRDKEIAVVGGGDSAIEEATFLTRFASKVTIIHRRDALRASKIMQKRAFDNPKIEFLWDSVVTAYLANGILSGLRVQNVKTGVQTDLPFAGVFIAIGHIPNTGLFKGQLEMHPNGYLVTQADCSYTNVEGVFACGDVQDSTYRQAVTAAGSGCMAALDAERWLEAQHDLEPGHNRPKNGLELT